ncbi:tetratricopeptide repeat (TPR)-like superfamily protein [Tasmannia lanceolata]|uniref:tetratricopeptide repeat (TPR)-like superfamily protein n=1 Tax=Tasmannia lanceolata TaxID=3420 RepID=UPI0040630952
MLRVHIHDIRSLGLKILNRMDNSYCTLQDISNPSKRICKIMISCPKLGLESALDESGIKVSPELAEEILKRFENAGMHAYRFFEWAEKQRNYSHSVKSYHIMIGSLAKIRQYQIMWDLVKSMGSKGILNIETFGVIMRKYARAQKVEEAVYTFNVMDKFGVTPNLDAFNSLLSALCKSKNVRKAQEIFDCMKDRFIPNSKTYSILLEGWGKDPNLPKAREVFRVMVDSGCDPDIVTYGIMVDLLCKAGRVEEAIGVVRDMDSMGCRPTSFIYSVLVHTYGSEKRIRDAINTFLEMERNGIKADVAVYNALVSAFCRVNKFEDVFKVLKEMDHKGIVANSRTYNIILNSLISFGENDEAFRVFRLMIKRCDPDSDTYTMMIKMLCESDKLELALKVWKYMGIKRFVPGMHTFSVLINGLCEKSEVSKACMLLEEMIEKGIRPPGPTFGKLKQLLLKEDRKDVLKFLEEKMKLMIKEPLCD